MPVLDLVCRDPQVTAVTLIEPDVFKPHNVVRHVFSAQGVGEAKADLAATWLRDAAHNSRSEPLMAIYSIRSWPKRSKRKHRAPSWVSVPRIMRRLSLLGMLSCAVRDWPGRWAKC